MFGKSIYLKLYLSFFVIFLLTLILVLVLASKFYGSHLKNEIVEYSLSEARFLRDEYAENCGPFPVNRPECRAFLGKIGKMGLLRFGILDPAGRVLYGSRRDLPGLTPDEILRAGSGEEIMSFGRLEPPRIALPVAGPFGKTQSILVLQRAPHRDRFPHFPLAFSLLVAGIAIAIMVLPLSHRITRQLRELHSLARKWSDGHLEERAVVRGTDEIAELGRVFNGMADNLQKMLQQKKEFLALISHELKSPVARMKIASEILTERHTSDPETSALLKGIQGDLEESEKMIEQLLLISRIEMDLPSAVQERIDAAMVVRRAVDQAEPVARVRDIRLECVVAAEAPVLRGDGAELQRAIANVIENAVKFSPPGSGVGIRVSSENNVVRITVSDSGPGIALEERDKVFEPFFRGKKAGDKNGSGLGLFLAQRIVERHGGKISASDNTPGGTLITIELPAAG
ncbi:MAG TPA: HAMP domain-containing sensor histidine kinase [Acidobacteriota bacterium]|nr:HAMP domain-containing sensor histidine kinase [Acidobacteriota bacterium]